MKLDIKYYDLGMEYRDAVCLSESVFRDKILTAFRERPMTRLPLRQQRLSRSIALVSRYVLTDFPCKPSSNVC